MVVKPTKRDLDSSMDNYEEKIKTQDTILALPIDLKQAMIGVEFATTYLPEVS